VKVVSGNPTINYNGETTWKILRLRSQYARAVWKWRRKSQLAVAFTQGEAKLFENVTSAVPIWARFLNGARWKRSAWWLRVNTNAVTFLYRLQTRKHLGSQNSKVECFLFKFRCSINCNGLVWTHVNSGSKS
jgi:hypothetical protein